MPLMARSSTACACDILICRAGFASLHHEALLLRFSTTSEQRLTWTVMFGREGRESCLSSMGSKLRIRIRNFAPKSRGIFMLVSKETPNNTVTLQSSIGLNESMCWPAAMTFVVSQHCLVSFWRQINI